MADSRVTVNIVGLESVKEMARQLDSLKDRVESIEDRLSDNDIWTKGY